MAAVTASAAPGGHRLDTVAVTDTEAPARQRVTTRPVDHEGPLLDLLPPGTGTLSWLRHGDGMVGWGERARYDTSGAGRFADAQRWWSEFTATLDVHDDVRLPGTGPVAFASVAFADEPGNSVLVVPEVLVGRRDGVTWMTSFSDPPALTPAPPPPGPVNLRYATGRLPVTGYRSAVAEAVRRIRTGQLRKVVLAHDLLATADTPIDPRFLLRGLAEQYPSCFCYAVDGLVGATPELLLRRRGDQVSARLLAGTVWPGTGTAEALLSSAKNRSEHAFGIDSLAAALRPFCTALEIPAEPSVIQLRNVAHLASDVHGTLADDTRLLRLAAAAHPTAAVGGTPTDLAVRTIAELEPMDRGRYAGPVGWIDAAGDGELGVALRCAELDGSTARLFAGCGIVAGSDPDTEATEAAAKFVPVRDALERS